MTYTPAEIARVAAGAGFTGDGLVTAVAVAMAESSGNPTAHLLTSREDSRGLWQINVRAHPSYDANRLYDPAYNAAAAYDISGGGTSWRAWSTYTNGAYRAYLPEARTAANASSTAIVPAGHLAATVGLPDPGTVVSTVAAGATLGPLGALAAGLSGLDPTNIADRAVSKIAEVLGPVVLHIGLEIIFTVAAFGIISMGVHRLTGTSPVQVFNKTAQVAGTGAAAAAVL